MKKTLVVAGAIAMLALAAPAQADVTHGNNGVATGNPIHMPITANPAVCGNNVGIGLLIAGCEGSPTAQVQSER
jgi:hypothetical protein